MSNTGDYTPGESVGTTREIVVHSAEYGTDGKVYAENGNYILHFFYEEQEYHSAICGVGKDTDMFIESIALWAMEDLIVDKKLEDAYALYVEKKE